jgi:GT2 family glycosyltransferase
MIDVVTATRLSAAEFDAEAPLALSLRRLEKDPRLTRRVAFDNKCGLPEIYDRAIEANDTGDILVFVHDDVWLEDFYFSDRVIEGLKAFDIIGVAGSTRRLPGQDGWARSRSDGPLDLPHLRGAIAHGEGPLGKVGFFGPIVGEVELLDGVFLAARREALLQNGIRFDPRFAFHFYDLDFCRTARSKGLRLGTWPISMTHRSTGSPNSPAWQEGRDAYFAKWGE